MKDQNDANTYNNRGVAKALLGEHHAAIRDFDKAIRLQTPIIPTHTTAEEGRIYRSINTLI